MVYCACAPVQAWNGLGHMVIASIAYRAVPVATREAASAILKSHPLFSDWKEQHGKQGDSMELEEFIWMRASEWPDEIRGKKGPFAEHDRFAWHFINYPLSPPEFHEVPAAESTNILEGIAISLEKVSGPGAAGEKAIYLSWLLHLIGDLHQPLHCANYISADFPKGDRGGNDCYIVADAQPLRLHAYWDGLLGRSDNPREARNIATELRERSASADSETDYGIIQWSLESRELAVESAYKRGRLAAGTTPEKAVRVEGSYGRDSKAIAESQVILAGARLAKLIESILK